METAATFQMTLTKFLQSLTARNLSENTIIAYRTDLRQLFTWLTETDGSVSSPTQITRSHLIEYLAYLSTLGRSGVTRARKLASIREYFKFLGFEELLPDSPAKNVAMPKKERKSRVFLRVDEYMKLLNAAAGDSRDYAILQVFLQTALRVSELAGLVKDDIDLDAGTLIVRTTTGKGKKERTIYLEKKATQALRAYYVDRDRLQKAQRTYDEHVFLNYLGQGISTRGVMDIVEKYRKKAGITKKFSCHSLRPTCATYKAAKGYQPPEIKDLLGHERETTGLIYVHMARDARKLMQQTSL